MKKSGIVYSKILVLVLIGALLGSCSGGGGGGSSSGAGGNTDAEQVAVDMSGAPVSMTYDERNTALAAVNAAWTALTSGDLDADNAALASFIRTQPAFADAGVSPDRTVWARFKDGRPVVWTTAKRVGVLNGPALQTVSRAVQSTSGAPRLAGELPKGTKAVLIDMDGIGRGGPAVVAPWLDKAGYVSEQPAGNLNDLMTKIKDVGVLYFATHGFFSVGQDGKRTYILSAAEFFGNQSVVTSGEDQLREQMYNEGLLNRTEYKRPNGAIVHYWAITEKFVATYWTFSQDSLIIIDACSLFDKSTAARAAVGGSFRAALTKAAGGKTTIVGWSDVVEANFAASTIKLLLDRVLGANSINPESPPQRPFSYKEVHDWMTTKGKITDPTAPGAKLTLEPNGTPQGMLVPSIQRAIVYTPASGSLYAGQWILELSGNFLGPEQGTVKVNGTQLTVHDWKDTTIIAKLPDSLDSPGSFGDIVAEVRGLKSNAVPLTQWRGTVRQSMTGTEKGSGASVDVTCPVRITSDAHFNRSAPGETPRFISSIVIEVPGSCTYTLSGTWVSGNVTYELSGSGSAAPLQGLKAYGTLRYTGSASALPVDHIGGITPLVYLEGTLKKTDRSVNPATVTTEQVFESWAYAFTDVNTTVVLLGADYTFSATRSCKGIAGSFPTVCTETWNVPPVLLTTPTVDTQM